MTVKDALDFGRNFGNMDRRNELVLIGQDMSEAELRQELRNCLYTKAEIRQWQRSLPFTDPWPAL